MKKFVILALLAACAAAACDIPSLETPECIAARPVVHEFYSTHFGGPEMKLSPEKLDLLERFLTPEFSASLRTIETENDVLTTNSTDHPKAFRVTGCETVTPDKAKLTVLLFWRDRERSEQKDITVEAEKRDAWLINKIIY